MSAQPSKKSTHPSDPTETTTMPDSDGAAAALVLITCPKHGQYEAYRAAGVIPIAGLNDCPRCIDQQQAEQDSDRRARIAQSERRERMKELVDIASIPKKYATVALSDYQTTLPGQRLAQQICQKYAQSWETQLKRGGSLVFTGGPGTGKTHLACAIVNHIIAKHMALAAFGTVSSVTRTVRATYSKNNPKTESQALADLMVPDLLIIDEVGASNGSEHELGLLFEIINRRYENLRPMILISNLSEPELKKLLGHRAMDRFAECGTVLAFDWPSHRGQQQVLL
jgi:DNA replication protein DnaC